MEKKITSMTEQHQKFITYGVGVPTIPYNRALTILLNGDAISSIVFNQLLYWHEKNDENAAIFKSVSDLISETCLTQKKVRGAIDRLKKLGLIECEIKGWGKSKRHFFKVKMSRIVDMVKQYNEWVGDEKSLHHKYQKGIM